MTKKDDRTEDPSLAALLGGGYAHVQHLMDRAIEWGFRRMRDTKAEPPPAATGRLGKAEAIGRGLLRFIGAAGDAYFTTYEKLKADERSKGKRRS